MVSLYNEDHTISEIGNQLDVETHTAVSELFDRWIQTYGYSPREVSQIMQSTIHELELTTVIGWRTPKNEENQNEINRNRH
jgi:hypothetical protein